MRPTGIGYVSPRERTPAHYTTLVSRKVTSMQAMLIVMYFC